MTTDVHATRTGDVVIAGATREEAAAVFAAAFEEVVATTFEEFEDALSGRRPRFVGISAGPGMVGTLQRALELHRDDPSVHVAIEVPSELVLAESVQAILSDAGVRQPEVRRFLEHPCIVVTDTPTSERGEDWFLESLIRAATTAPDARRAEQDRLSFAWEREAAKQQLLRQQQRIEELQTTLRKVRKTLAQERRKRSAASGAPQTRPAPTTPGKRPAPKQPAARRVRSPGSVRVRGRRLLNGVLGLLGARTRSRRVGTLALLGVAVVALLAGTPTVFGVVGGSTGALVGLALGVTVLVLCGVGAVLLLQIRSLRSAQLQEAGERKTAAQSVAQRAAAHHAKTRSRIDDVEQLLAEQAEAVAKIPTTAPATAAQVKRSTTTVTRQVQATLNLFSMVEVRAPVPPMAGWAAAPDLIAEVVDILLHERPRVVLDVGSGVSTLFLALAAQQHDLRTRIVAIEHDLGYAVKTRALLERHGVGDRAEVRHAPLERTRLADHVTPWYAAAALDDLAEIGLVLVDGPPAATGPSPRYPLVPMVIDRLADEGCTIVVDDVVRPEDREVVDRWARQYPELDVEFLPLQKGAAVLRRPPGRRRRTSEASA